MKFNTILFYTFPSITIISYKGKIFSLKSRKERVVTIMRLVFIYYYFFCNKWERKKKKNKEKKVFIYLLFIFTRRDKKQWSTFRRESAYGRWSSSRIDVSKNVQQLSFCAMELQLRLTKEKPWIINPLQCKSCKETC